APPSRVTLLERTRALALRWGRESPSLRRHGASAGRCGGRPRRRRLRAAQGPRGGRPPPPLPPAPLAQRLQVVRARHGRAAGRDGERGGPLPRGVQEGGAGAGGRHGRADRGALLPLDAHRGHGAARLGRARAPRAARAYGTANIHNCSFYCHNASSVALAQVYGSGTASITLEDLAQADLVLLAGANPASNHPRLVGQLVQLRLRGGKVLMVNPLRE